MIMKNNALVKIIDWKPDPFSVSPGAPGTMYVVLTDHHEFGLLEIGRISTDENDQEWCVLTLSSPNGAKRLHVDEFTIPKTLLREIFRSASEHGRLSCLFWLAAKNSHTELGRIVSLLAVGIPNANTCMEAGKAVEASSVFKKGDPIGERYVSYFQKLAHEFQRLQETKEDAP